VITPGRRSAGRTSSPHRHLECGLQLGLETDQKAATGGDRRGAVGYEAAGRLDEGREQRRIGFTHDTLR
jgi:hypothetical protein